MGTRAAWGLLMANPGIFAGAILSSGATYATQDSLADIVGIPIRNFYGSEDEDGLEATTNTTMTRYVSLCGIGEFLSLVTPDIEYLLCNHA